jgi:hypothetical protein
LNAYRLSGNGIALAPYPARRTVRPFSRHDTPVRGAKFLNVRFTLTALVVSP